MTTPNAAKQAFFRNQQGFQDVARRFVLGMGQPPSFRDFAEDAIGRMQMPFALRAAMGQLPSQGLSLDQLVQSPDAFEAFLREPGQADFQYPETLGGNQVNRTLSDVARYLRKPSTSGLQPLAGQDLLRQLLLGPSGSVGSEMFAPTIGMVTQDVGRRFMPGLGAAARRATTNALQSLLAQDPGRFTDLADFIDFLASQGLIQAVGPS